MFNRSKDICSNYWLIYLYVGLNYTLHEIAELYGVVESTIALHLQKAGIKRRDTVSGIRGKPQRKEHSKKISVAHTGKTISESQKKQISNTVSELWKDEKYRAHMSAAHLGKKLTDEHKAEISVKLIGNKCSLGYKHSLEARQKMSEKQLIIHNDPIFRKNHSECMKRIWENDEYAKKVMGKHGMSLEELRFENYLNVTFPDIFKYVGNKSFRIGRKFPDFVDRLCKKLIIELWGDFYHKGQNPQDRIDYFKPFGYKTVVIWASEFQKNKSVVINKISALLSSAEV